MNILLAINSKYLLPAKVLITSIFENNDVNINIYLLHSSLNEVEIKELRKVVEGKYNGKLIDILINEKDFKDFPLSHHFTIETYYRFLAQSILPEEVDRILWLDADMIVKKSISDFYNQDFEGKYVVVCQSINKNPMEILQRLELDSTSKYFNAGTILFNLKDIRKNIKPSIYFEYIRDNKDKIKWLDQDVLNVIFNTSSKYDDNERYNKQIFSEHKFNAEQLEYIENNTAIIHYIGAIKPWHYKYENKCKNYYWRYALISEGIFHYIRFYSLNYVYTLYKKIKYKFNLGKV
ncbi:glycosyltransferase family 8 protein [Clostridium sp. NSJ-145]|uniref:glycosyltransferase family 8 protein n=1 Tax=Clostridium sp. NSJ-145 TaxID=2897777 RepID=UPI001E3FDB31|nr:glycosyltransferase family 8 protein [Clostridium sp. NSJ-145]MCD2502364.1 glycosyltransferase family 8 protein [Clostridium sp. NSJ-145]